MAYKPHILAEVDGGTGTSVLGVNMSYSNLREDGSDFSVLSFTNGKFTGFNGFITKVFNFQDNTESWVATPGDARVDMAWKRPYHPSSTPNRLALELGGSLRTTARNNAPSTENYWEFPGSWEDMGVPAGATVTSCSARYLYCFMGKEGNGSRNIGNSTNNNNEAIFADNELGTGPFELRYDDTTLVGKFSKRIFAPERTLLDLWHRKPVDPAQPYTPFRATPFPITAYPPSWGITASTILNIPLDLQASNSLVRLRLNSLLPATAALTTNLIAYWVRLRQDRVEVTINFTS